MAKNAVPSSNKTSVGLKKRDQIARGNRTMFLWVAGASVIVAFSLVASIFLFKQLLFNQKVLNEKNKTVSILKQNIDNTKVLHKRVNELRADRSISSVASNVSDSNNLDKILDALPYVGDWVGLGSSLQSTLLNGVALDSLTVDSTSGDAISSSTIDTSTLSSVGDAQPITFSFKVSGTDTELKTLLQKLDRSIRPIKLVNLQFQSAGPNKLEMTVQALTYYQPKKTFELKETTIKP